MKKYIKSSFFYFSICIILFSTAGLMSVFLANILKRMIDTSTEKNITQFYHVMILTIFFIVINCKSQYKNVGLGQYKNVGFPTFLYCLFSLHLL